MATLFNTRTRKPDTVADADLEAAILSGSHSYQASDRVNVISPEDKKTYSIQATELKKAIEQGFRLETGTQREVRKYVDDNKGLKGAAKVALGQFADEALMGLPEMIFDRTADPLEVAKKEALKKEHDLANTVGGVAGFGASMFAPGLNIVAKGATKAGEKVAGHIAEKLVAKSAGEVSKRSAGTIARDVLKRMAPETAQMATEGLVFSAPHAITEAALADSDSAGERFELAGESLLAGVGLGALFGAGGRLAKDLTKTSRDFIQSRILKDNATFTQSFKENAAEKAVEALNPTLAQQERLLPPHKMKEVGRDLLDEKIVTPFASVGEVYQKLDARTRELGKQIGDSLKLFDDLGEQVAQHEAATTGRAVSFRVDPKEVAAKLQKEVVEKYAGTPAYKTSIATFGREIDNLKAIEGTWSIAEANAQKAAYGDVINNWGLDQPINKKFLQEIYGAINEAVEKKIDEVGQHPLVRGADGALSPLAGVVEGGSTSDLLKNFKALKKKYGNLETAELISKKSAAREAKNNDFGLTAYILGAGGFALGDNPIESVGYGAAGLFGRQFIRKYGNQILAGTYDKAGTLFAERSLKQTAKRMDEIPSILQRMASSAAAVKPSTLTLGATARFLGRNEEASSASESKAERMAAIREKLDALADESILADKIANLSTPISEAGAPNIGAEFNRKMAAAHQALNQIIPRETSPRSPFAPSRKFVPSDSDMAKLENTLEVIMDPFVVLDRLEAGTLNQTHIETLQAVYPKILSAIQEKVMDAAADGSVELPYGKRIKLSLLLGIPLDPSLSPERFALLQETFQEPQAGGEEQQSTGSKKAPRKTKLKNDYQTKVDRIQSKGE